LVFFFPFPFLLSLEFVERFCYITEVFDELSIKVCKPQDAFHVRVTKVELYLFFLFFLFLFSFKLFSICGNLSGAVHTRMEVHRMDLEICGLVE